VSRILNKIVDGVAYNGFEISFPMELKDAMEVKFEGRLVDPQSVAIKIPKLPYSLRTESTAYLEDLKAYDDLHCEKCKDGFILALNGILANGECPMEQILFRFPSNHGDLVNKFVSEQSSSDSAELDQFFLPIKTEVDIEDGKENCITAWASFKIAQRIDGNNRMALIAKKKNRGLEAISKKFAAMSTS